MLLPLKFRRFEKDLFFKIELGFFFFLSLSLTHTHTRTHSRTHMVGFQTNHLKDTFCAIQAHRVGERFVGVGVGISDKYADG